MTYTPNDDKPPKTHRSFWLGYMIMPFSYPKETFSIIAYMVRTARIYFLNRKIGRTSEALAKDIEKLRILCEKHKADRDRYAELSKRN